MRYRGHPKIFCAFHQPSSYSQRGKRRGERERRLNMTCITKHSPQKLFINHLAKFCRLLNTKERWCGNDKIMGRLYQGALGTWKPHTCLWTHTNTCTHSSAGIWGKPWPMPESADLTLCSCRERGNRDRWGHTGLLGGSLPAKASAPQVCAQDELHHRRSAVAMQDEKEGGVALASLCPSVPWHRPCW